MTKYLNELVGERIDRLMTIEIRPLTGGLPSGYVQPLYDVCRKHHGQPLSMLAAQSLCDAVKPGDTVFIGTGAGVAPNLPWGETDGPPGAAVLARALARGFGCNVVIVTENIHLRPVEACAEVANATLEGSGSISVINFPKGLAEGQRTAEHLFHEYNPTAVIFVERDGPNAEGYFHGVRGDYREPEAVGHVYLLADIARMKNVLSIGVGDGGNEVGFGDVRDAVTAVHPLGAVSKGGFPSGVITVTGTDIIVAASVSNWGAYGISAALAYLRKQPDLIHSPELERHLVDACVNGGGRDGANGLHQPSVDGIDLDGHAAFVQLLNAIVKVSR
jgi:hypothetical protein